MNVVPIRSVLPAPIYDKRHLVHLRKIGRTYYVDYMFEGRRVRESLKTDDLDVAERNRSELEFKLRAKTLRLPVQIRFETFLVEYLSFIKTQLARMNYSIQARYFGQFEQAYPGLRLAEIENRHIESFILRRNQGRPSPKTWNNVRGYFHAMLEFARNRGYVLENVAQKVRRQRNIQRSIRFLKTQEEISNLIGLFFEDALEAMVVTFIYSGLRRTEACWLTWQDVDFSARLIHVREKTVDGECWWPKTKRNRVVPISSRLLPHLERQRTNYPRSIWVFPSPEGFRWWPDNVTHRFEKVVRGAGLPWTLLDLRHTFGSQMAIKGVSLYKIAKLMGNSAQICERHYAALIPEEMHQEVEF
jgi:integrase